MAFSLSALCWRSIWGLLKLHDGKDWLRGKLGLVLMGRTRKKEMPKKGNAWECSNYHTVALISHASKVMLKILHARLQHYMNHELLDVQAGFRKDRGTRDQIANIHWIIEKPTEFQTNIRFWFIDYTKAFDCMKVKSLSHPTLCKHMNCSLPGSSVHGIFWVGVLEWVAVSFSRKESFFLSSH